MTEREQAALETARYEILTDVEMCMGHLDTTQMNILSTGINRGFTAALAIAAEQRAPLEHQNKGLIAELYECEQIIGKALGYPTEGPEIGGDHTTVCVGEAVGCPHILAQQLVKQRAEDRKVMEQVRDLLTHVNEVGVHPFAERGIMLALAAIRARLEVE